MAFTFNTTKYGTVEVFRDGKRIATTTPQNAAQTYGYTGETELPALPETTPTPEEPTLPETPSAIVPPTLPETPAQGGQLVAFKNLLNTTLALAEQKRNKLAVEFAQPMAGTLSASDFGSILQSLNVASQQFQKEEFGDIFKQQEKERQEIFDMGVTARKYGAPNDIVQKGLQSSNKEQALGILGDYLTDPKAKYDLEAARLDNLIKQKQLTVITKEEKEAQAAQKASLETIPILNDKISLIDELLVHPGMKKAVGARRLARFTPFRIDVSTGQVSDFSAGVEQLTSKETIDTLVNLKARGGTLGALSDQERIMLQTAATRIGAWRRVRDDGSEFYETSEASFTKELEMMKVLTQRALDKAVGNSLSEDERSILDELYSGESSSFSTSPELYY